jgi:hypothetical protein
LYNNLKELISEIFSPSNKNESPYTSLLIFLGHFVLGAALAHIFPPILAISLFVLKELFFDIVYKKGNFKDSIIDSLAVGLGAVAFNPGIAIVVAVVTSISKGNNNV